jgi:hypothetical protein
MACQQVLSPEPSSLIHCVPRRIENRAKSMRPASEVHRIQTPAASGQKAVEDALARFYSGQRDERRSIKQSSAALAMLTGSTLTPCGIPFCANLASKALKDTGRIVASDLSTQQALQSKEFYPGALGYLA